MKEIFAVLFVFLLMGWAYCIDVSDTSQIESSKRSRLITLKTFEVPAGVTLELTDLLPGTVVEFDGTLTFGYAEWDGPLVRVRGHNVTVVGKIGHLIDGNGQRWWDGKGSNGGKVKPKFFELTLTGSTVKGLNVKNSPVHAFTIRDCSDVNVTDIKIDNSAGDVNGGHNTDGFDVNSRNVRISNSWVHNQDDCLAVNYGSNIIFENNTCIGGHGISIGSVGFRHDNVVERVTIQNCEVINSTNGIRIKTKTNATGSVNNITYNNVTLKNITKYGILIHSNYQNVGNMAEEPTPGVPLTSISVSNVGGSVLQEGTNVYVAVGNASNWTWDNVNITGGRIERNCQGVPLEVSVICGK